MADAYVQIEMRDFEANNARVRQVRKELTNEGMTWFRFTAMPEHSVIIIEGWKVRPEVEPPFEPLLTPA